MAKKYYNIIIQTDGIFQDASIQIHEFTKINKNNMEKLKFAFILSLVFLYSMCKTNHKCFNSIRIFNYPEDLAKLDSIRNICNTKPIEGKIPEYSKLIYDDSSFSLFYHAKNNVKILIDKKIILL